MGTEDIIEEEYVLTKEEKIVRKKRTDRKWPGLEKGIPRAFNKLQEAMSNYSITIIGIEKA